jgi:hypothetical protein
MTIEACIVTNGVREAANGKEDGTNQNLKQQTLYTRCPDAGYAGRQIFGEDRAMGSGVLILPTLCVGNVGQLAVDLLLSAFKDSVEHVATLRHPLVLPCFGVNPYANDRLDSKSSVGTESHAAHPIDLYRFKEQGDVRAERRVYLLQQRAPATPGCQASFSRDLMEWVRDSKGISEVWILGSVDAEYRRDVDLRPASGSITHNVKFCAMSSGDISHTVKKMVDACDSVGLQAFGGAEDEEYRDLVEDEGRQSHMPWAMISAARQCNIPAVGVIKFVLEGDNRPDAMAMAGVASRLVGLGEVNFSRCPPSWVF